MSKTTTETKITPQYLRGKTKDEIIDHVMRLLKENDDLRGLPEHLKPEMIAVLRLMNYQTGPIAHALRDHGGWDIPKKCEDEQAEVLYYLLGLVYKHGEDWRTEFQKTVSDLLLKAKEAKGDPS